MATLIEQVPEELLTAEPRDKITELLRQPEEYDPALVTLSSLTNLVYLIRAAKQASAKASSWRDFNVGAAAMAYDLSRGRIGFLLGYNFKPVNPGEVNIHAEQIVIAKARYHGLDRIFSMAVWGKEQPDQQSDILSATLHPCGRCREMMRTEAPEITPETVILSGNADFSVCEIFTLSE